MSDIDWDRYPLVAANELARSWLAVQRDLGLSSNTIDAYARGLSDFLASCARRSVEPTPATKADIASYVRDLATRSRLTPTASPASPGLSNATIRQRLTAVRLFFDYLIEEGIRETNPVGRGRFTPGKAFGGERSRALVPRFVKAPWIPSEDDWTDILKAAKKEPPRNRLMFALAYDAALRREELCRLEVADLDPARRLIRIRAEITKNRHERVVPYSTSSGELYVQYLRSRLDLSRSRGRLFLSESRRNRSNPISVWTWSKVVEGIADRSGVDRFTTHSLRHLCLTDLARAGWDVHEIAKLAGHRSLETTMAYLHLSGRELAERFERSIASLHAKRVHQMVEEFE